MGKSAVLRKLAFPRELFDRLAREINDELIQSMDLQNVPAKRIEMLRRFAEAVDASALEAIEDKVEKRRNEYKQLSKEDQAKVVLTDEEIDISLMAKLTCPERVRKSICDILIQSARTAALSKKKKAIEEVNKERAKEKLQPLQAGLSAEDFEITAGMRKELYKAIVRPEGEIGEVKLDPDEWALLEPIWSDKGADKDSWQFGIYTEACVLAIKNEIFDKAEEIDMKS